MIKDSNKPMSDMVRSGGAQVIHPRTELTLHRAPPPTRPARSLSRSPLRPLDEECRDTTHNDAMKDTDASPTLRRGDSIKSSIFRRIDSIRSSSSSFKRENSIKLSTFRREGSVESSPLQREDSVKSSPFRKEDSAKSFTFRRAESVKSPPFRREDSTKSSTFRRAESVKSPPFRREDITKSYTFGGESRAKPPPFRGEDIIEPSPLGKKEDTQPTPLYREESLKSFIFGRDDSRTSITLQREDSVVSSPTFRRDDSIRRDHYSYRRQGSQTSRSSSLSRALRNRSRPLYREARVRMRAARRWANNFRRRVKTKGGVPLLTPSRSRRHRTGLAAASPSPSCRQFETCVGSSSPGTAARNSPRVRATHRAASAAREVRWEAASGLAALLECSASAGSAAVAAAARLCTAVVTMADARLQQLRRSISSWSLSTIKKPKISIPKLRTPSLNLFTGRKKNRVNPKDEEEAVEDVKLALLKVEKDSDPASGCSGDGVDKVGGQIIHEPQKTTGETLPTIVLTVHDHSAAPDPQPPSPNPGLLAPNDDIEYIDSDDDDDRFIRGASTTADYSDQWFECKGTLSRSHEDLSKVGLDYEEYPESTYYETTEVGNKNQEVKCDDNEMVPKTSDNSTTGPVSRTVTEGSPEKQLPKENAKVDEEICSKKHLENIQGSQKAREWVQSLDEDAERRVERWIQLQKEKNTASIPKSKSEIRLDSLDDPPGKWATRNEINLNAPLDDEAYAQYLECVNSKVECAGDSGKDDAAKRESLKRVFKVRGKLSNKTIVDSQRPSYKNTDIYIASAPYALANSASGHQDSHDESEDGINCASVDLEPALELDRRVAETEKDIVSMEVRKDEIPDIVINEPEIESNEVSNPQAEECLNSAISDDYRYSSPSTDNAEDSTLQEVTWSNENNLEQNGRDIQNQNNEPYENEPIKPETRNVVDVESEKPPPAIAAENFEADITMNDSTSSPTTPIESNILQKPDRKKKKISAPHIPKSIKNLAGSIFSQQTDIKYKKEQIEEKDTEKKKRRSRLSPFNKDYLFKNSSKSNNESTSSNKVENDLSNNLPKVSSKDSSLIKSIGASTDGSLNPSASQDTSADVEHSKDGEKTNSKTVMSDLPSSDSVKSCEEEGKGSSESLEYISPIESDEQKSISHESSPGFGNPFVEEDGLLIRKDALLAVKRMENDDTSTHYYSFLSATDDRQSPFKEAEKPVMPLQTDIVQPLKEISVFHEPPQNKELVKLPSDNKGSIPLCTSDTSSSIADSDSQSTIKSSQQYEGNEGPPDVNTKSVNKDNTVSQRPPVQALELESFSPLCRPTPIVKETAADEVPKLNLAAELQQVVQEPPKPSPRTKKGRYGYSTGSLTPTTPTAPVNTIPSKETSTSSNQLTPPLDSHASPVNSSPKLVEANSVNKYAQHKTSSSVMSKVEAQRNSADSGYAGPGNNYYESEPIYWEISETKDAPPRPSPRGKKGQRTPSEQSLTAAPISVSITSSTPVPSPKVESKAYDSQQLPEWINKRAPIPSPRTKKQRSLQSLPTVVPADDNMETVKKKLQSLSSVPIACAQLPQLPVHKSKTEDQFYSGKAASIAYGFTPEPSIPSPPVRGKKASQVSLPAAVAVEETVSKQLKRASLHEPGLKRTHDKGMAPLPPSVRRSRRRTDPTHGITAAAFRGAVQRFDSDLMQLTDLLVAVGLGATNAQRSEEHLCGVLYSVHALMGAAGGGTWTVSNGSGRKDSAPGNAVANHNQKNSVTLAEVTKELQAAYQVNQDTFDRLLEQAKKKPTPEVQLHLSLKEAKDLRPKTVKGKTNSYATVVIPSSGDTHRTRLQKNTLDPVWNQDFTLKVNNLQKDVLRVEVWHEHDAVGVQQLTAVRDIKSFGRLVKGTTQQAKQHHAHLLGGVVLHVKSMSEAGGWYPLEKEGELSKDRGCVHVEGKVVSTAQLDSEGRKSYDALLTRLVHRQIMLRGANEEEEQWTTPWNGHLNLSATAALAQHAIMLGLSDAQLQLSWWLIGCRVATVDAVWTLSQLHRVQSSVAKGLYNAEELSELSSSLSYFVRAHAERLKDLHTTFPSSSGVLAQRQFTYTLKALHSLQTHKPSRQLLDQEAIPHVEELVTSSINTHTKNWWTLLVEEQLRGVKTADEQISRVIVIVDEAYKFLNQATIFYNSVFMKEMNIPYMQTTYLTVSKKINPCVRPLLMNIYNRMPALQDRENSADTNIQYALEVGTSLWQLYRNLGRLHTLGESLPPEARAESGVREYHRWFSKGVMRWLELAICRAQSMVRRAVELDNFEPVDDLCDFSSSATDTTGIFHDVKIWWLKLMWPDPEHSAVLLAKILEDICSCGTTYSDLLRARVDQMFQRQSNTDRVFITQQICVGLNNIERVRRELTGLPGHFGFDATLEEIRRSSNGTEAASQLEATVDRLIISATENMEAKVNEFIEAVIHRMKPTLDRALQEACETQSEGPLLEKELDPAIQLLHNHLHSSNFQRFLWYLWEALITLFKETVTRNAERRKASYFGGVYDLLEASLKFFSPDSGEGLDLNEARTQEYSDLLDLLDSLRISTESLIAKYYQERHDEQSEASLPSKAQLVVKVLFTRPGKLMVEVIMARDMVTDGDGGSVSSRGGGLHPNLHSQPVDSYVKVQLVPQEWFPSATVRKTRTQRKSDPAVYEETFEYDMSRNDDGVRAGLLLFTLKDYNLGRSNTFIGEALVPLSSLPCVDSSQVHTVPNTYLKMTTPGLDLGYKSLRALHLRTSDRIACSFLKKVSKRLPETKKPEDERGRPKSPNIMDRFKFT